MRLGGVKPPVSAFTWRRIDVILKPRNSSLLTTSTNCSVAEQRNTDTVGIADSNTAAVVGNNTAHNHIVAVAHIAKQPTGVDDSGTCLVSVVNAHSLGLLVDNHDLASTHHMPFGHCIRIR